MLDARMQDYRLSDRCENEVVTRLGKLLEDAGGYRRSMEKLNYLTVTRPDITFTVSVVSQFLSASKTTLGGDNEDFEVSEEISRERVFFIQTRNISE